MRLRDPKAATRFPDGEALAKQKRAAPVGEPSAGMHVEHTSRSQVPSVALRQEEASAHEARRRKAFGR